MKAFMRLRWGKNPEVKECFTKPITLSTFEHNSARQIVTEFRDYWEERVRKNPKRFSKENPEKEWWEQLFLWMLRPPAGRSWIGLHRSRNVVLKASLRCKCGESFKNAKFWVEGGIGCPSCGRGYVYTPKSKIELMEVEVTTKAKMRKQYVKQHGR